MAQILKIYAKGETEAAFTGDATSVAITGLTAGTEVAAGDYLIARYDDATGEESERVSVPAFTVLAAAPTEPTDVATEATEDGAKVTAK